MCEKMKNELLQRNEQKPTTGPLRTTIGSDEYNYGVGAPAHRTDVHLETDDEPSVSGDEHQDGVFGPLTG